MSEKKKSKWLMGCGIGCGTLLLIAVIGGVIGYNFLKKNFEVFEEVEVIEKDLTDKYGKIDQYIPTIDGIIPSDKIIKFLKIRESINESNNLLLDSLKRLDSLDDAFEDKKEKSLKKIIKSIKSGFSFAKELGNYYKNLYNSMLLNEIGLGEYLYLYISSYYSYLKKPFDVHQNLRNIEKTNLNITGKKGFEEIFNSSRTTVNRILRTMFESWLLKLTEDSPLKKQLITELTRMEENYQLLPWSDQTPEFLKKSFDPFKDKLEQTFNSEASSFEIFFVEIKIKRGTKFNVNFDNKEENDE